VLVRSTGRGERALPAGLFTAPKNRIYLSPPLTCVHHHQPLGPLSHLSPLSGRVSPLARPDPAGYAFPLPFGCWPSLLGTSSPPGVVVLPCGWPTAGQDHSWTPGRPHEGCHVPHPSSAVGVGAPYTPGPGVRAGGYLAPPALTQFTVFINHPPVSERDGAS